MRARRASARNPPDQADNMSSMRFAAAIVVLVSVQGCKSLSQEKQACPAFAGYAQLAAPPDNVEQLYALKDFGKLRKGYHEHWYKPDDDSLAACRHLKRGGGGCATEQTRFVRTPRGWDCLLNTSP